MSENQLDTESNRSLYKKTWERAVLKKRKSILLVLVPWLLLGCGPEPDPEAAGRLLSDARQESIRANYSLARKHLEQAAPLAPSGSQLRDEIDYEREYRLTMAEAVQYLQEHDSEAFSSALSDLERWIEEHPSRVLEARHVEDLRRAGKALDRAMGHNLRMSLREVEILLETALAEGEYPPDEETFNQLWQHTQSHSKLELVYYHRLSDTEYEAEFEDSETGRRGQIRSPEQENPDDWGNNPTLEDLINAIHRGDSDAARALIAFDIDLNEFHHGETPLSMAISGRRWDIALELLSAGVDPNLPVPQYNNKMPLRLALSWDPPEEMVAALLESGARVNAQDKKGVTALMEAARKGAVDIIRTLLREGADPLIEDRRGNTAANYARSAFNSDEISQLLKEAESGQLPESEDFSEEGFQDDWDSEPEEDWDSEPEEDWDSEPEEDWDSEPEEDWDSEPGR